MISAVTKSNCQWGQITTDGYPEHPDASVKLLLTSPVNYVYFLRENVDGLGCHKLDVDISPWCHLLLSPAAQYCLHTNVICKIHLFVATNICAQLPRLGSSILNKPTLGFALNPVVPYVNYNIRNTEADVRGLKYFIFVFVHLVCVLGHILWIY